MYLVAVPLDVCGDTHNNIGLSKTIFSLFCKSKHDVSEAQFPSIFYLHLYIPEMFCFFHKFQNSFTSSSYYSWTKERKRKESFPISC